MILLMCFDALGDELGDQQATGQAVSPGCIAQRVEAEDAVDEAVQDQAQVHTVLCVRRTEQAVAWSEGRDVWLHEALDGVGDECAPEPMDAEDADWDNVPLTEHTKYAYIAAPRARPWM